MNLEQSTADVILEKKKEIAIGDKTYLVAKPSFATLILLSEFISQLPTIDAESDEDTLKVSLFEAKNAAFLGEMIAILVLGARKCEPIELDGVIKYPAKDLGKEINYELDLEEIFGLFFDLLKDLKIVFFSQITTFLKGVNLTKKTT